MSKTKEKFPKQIYVGKEHDRDDEFLTASETHIGLEETNGTRQVGIYQLVRVATIVNKNEVV